MKEKPRVLIVESDARAAAQVSKLLWDAECVVDAVTSVEGAIFRMRDLKPHLVVSNIPDEMGLCAQVKKVAPLSAILLVVDGPVEQADRRARLAGADGFLLAPLNPGAVVSCASFAARMVELTKTVGRLREDLDEQALAPLPGTPASARDDFEFLKRMLLMEVRRSRRYRYPLALVLVGVDRYEETLGRTRVHERTRIMKLLLQTVQEDVRDIDLAVLYGPDRFLLALPQTDLEGAKHVAERLHEMLPPIISGKLGGPKVTMSGGVSAYDGSDTEVSFQGMLDEATARLEKAKRDGGNRVESVPLPKR